MLRLIHFIKRVQGVTPDAFAQFRRDQLGPFVAGLQARLNLCRYVQMHRSAGSDEAEHVFISDREGTTNAFDGMEEYWWPCPTAALTALRDATGAFADILRFSQQWVDPAASCAWLSVDYPQVSTSAGRIVAAPKSGVRRLVFAISAAASVGTDDAQRYWLMQHGPLVRGFAVARGSLAYHQVHRLFGEAYADGLQPGLRADCPFMGHAEAWFSETPFQPGADSIAAKDAAIADERHFIDWSRCSVLIGKELVFVDRCWI